MLSRERLKVKAENAIEMDKTATRLLRIEVNDVNDNLPIFSEIHSSVPLVFMIQSGNTVVGQLKAVDIDDAPYNSTYYYMLPSCSNRDGIFTVDKQTGVVSVTNFNDLKYDEYHLCALASAFNMSKIPEIAFDSNNASMMAFTVRTETNNVVEQMNKMKHLFENHTVSVFGIDSETTIPVTRLKSHQPTITYQLGSMRFTPAENEEISKESAPYFTIDSVSGDIRIDPMLGDYTEGVFTFDIVATQQRTTTESIQIAHIVKQVHNVKFPSLLKFIFDQNVHLLGLNLEDFNQHLHNALKLEPALSDISVIFGIPHVYESAGRNRSSVCFHTLRNGVILRQENAISALSATLNGGGTLSRLYQVFKVANIEPCIEVTRILSSGLMISRSALFWTGFSLVGILILISFCIYACFIIRYKNYLNMKKASLVGETSSATVSIKQPPSVPFYSINNLPTLDY
uniref:Cadherin domain-containing protein n=1 Tax=Onchocerca volvulus TaxID=6282 RepID=A0A8R1Y399_ONCVO